MSGASHVEALGRRVSQEWPHITKARAATEGVKRNLQDLLVNHERFTSADSSIVCYGSLGRDEWTRGSDLDWTLLIDGQADPQHRTTRHEIETLLRKEEYKEPGRTGTFGSMTFSHELIHHIGGAADTNANITRRILLLLESHSVGDEKADARSRVIRQILNSYFEEGWGLIDLEKQCYRVPLFFLNDVVRFWRTMAVDFASKHKERGGEGWGLRNAKLRMSRKLIFVSGLLICLGCYGVPTENEGEIAEDNYEPLVQSVLEDIELTPLDVLSKYLLKYEAESEVVMSLLDPYDRFLEILDNEEYRSWLKNKVRPENARADARFQEIRDLSKKFRQGLERFFFENEELGPLTKQYGVF